MIYDQPFSSGNEPGFEYNFLEGMTYGWSENGAYVGWIPFILFVVGAIFSFKKYWKLTSTSLVFLWLSFGNRTSISLWNLLHALPVFSSMRVAQRFIILFLFCLAIVSGVGLSKIRKALTRVRMKRSRLLSELISTIILISVLLDLLLVGNPIFSQAFTYSPPQNLERASFISFWDTVIKTVDQKAIDSDLNPIELYGDSVLAQSFTPGISNLSGIGLYKDRLGSPANLVIELYADSEGNVTSEFFSRNDVLTRTSLPSISTALNGGRFDWISLDFDNLIIGKKYWIICYQEDYGGNEENLYHICSITNVYSNGFFAQSWNRGNNWAIDRSIDLFFMTCQVTEEERGKYDETIESNDKFHQIIGRYRFMYPAFLLNLGTVQGYEQAMYFQRKAIPLESPEYRGEVFLSDAHIIGNVSITFFSPNLVKVSVNSSSNTKVVLNQNYSPSWKVEGSWENEVKPFKGLVSTKIRKGQHNLTFHYFPESFVIGSSLTAITIILVLALYILSYRRKFLLLKDKRMS